MKCNKCGAEVRDGSSFCPACGKSLAEDKKIKTGKRYKKGLFAPLVSLIIGAGGWIYTFLYQRPFLMNLYNELMGNTVSIDDSSLYNSLTDAVDTKILLIVGAIGIVFALLAVVGLITLLKRLWNRLAHKDED